MCIRDRNESVRELEGIINSLLAQSIIFKRDVDLDLAEDVYKRQVSTLATDLYYSFRKSCH